jgi:hypothetical protein
MDYQEILYEEMTSLLDQFHFLYDGLMTKELYEEWYSEQQNSI